MRTSPYSLWARLRELLAERGLIISTTVLVYLFPDGPHSETGVAVSDGGRVYEFGLGYDRTKAAGERNAVIEHWRDITGQWQAHAFSAEIADTFIWRPPARRTHLVLAPGMSQAG
ncbi:hypothetical protein ACH4U5_01990 [Streptomyces sp. NPDC020858]|uniref:hypothetical protein n=1 Tax=Streptomyces sp. NPDC020858 TaxID=3365097 RepID=UPI0037BBAB62